MTKLFKILVLVGTLALFSGCEKSGEIGKVHFDRDLCEHCKMVVSDPKFSVDVLENGKNYYFDDIGCLVEYMAQNDKFEWIKTAQIYVNDASSGEFIDAKTAYFYEGYNTPMAFGYGAFKLKKLDKTALNFTQLVEILKTNGNAHSGGMHGSHGMR